MTASTIIENAVGLEDEGNGPDSKDLCPGSSPASPGQQCAELMFPKCLLLSVCGYQAFSNTVPAKSKDKTKKYQTVISTAYPSVLGLAHFSEETLVCFVTTVYLEGRHLGNADLNKGDCHVFLSTPHLLNSSFIHGSSSERLLCMGWQPWI